MSGNFAIKGGGVVGRLMANAILNFHFDFLTPSLTRAPVVLKTVKICHNLPLNKETNIFCFLHIYESAKSLR